MTDGDKIKLRAELAGKAMAAMISSDTILKISNNVIANTGMGRAEWIAEQSTQFADALMKELGLDGE